MIMRMMEAAAHQACYTQQVVVEAQRLPLIVLSSYLLNLLLQGDGSRLHGRQPHQRLHPREDRLLPHAGVFEF
jgi:hypothetical protein